VAPRLLKNGRRGVAVLVLLAAVAAGLSSAVGVSTPRAAGATSVVLDPVDQPSAAPNFENLEMEDASWDTQAAPAAVQTDVYAAAEDGQLTLGRYLMLLNTPVGELPGTVPVIPLAALAFDAGLAIGTLVNLHYIHSWTWFNPDPTGKLQPGFIYCQAGQNWYGTPCDGTTWGVSVTQGGEEFEQFDPSNRFNTPTAVYQYMLSQPGVLIPVSGHPGWVAKLASNVRPIGAINKTRPTGAYTALTYRNFPAFGTPAYLAIVAAVKAHPLAAAWIRHVLDPADYPPVYQPPDCTGLSVTACKQQMTAFGSKGTVSVVFDTTPNPNLPVGATTRASPDPSMIPAQNAPVTIYINPPWASVPDCHGIAVQQCEQTLQAAGFTNVSTVTSPVIDSTILPGTVRVTAPPVNSAVSLTSPLVIEVNPDYFIVPDCSNVSKSDCLAQLAAFGYTGPVSIVAAADILGGTGPSSDIVVASSPGAGAAIDPATGITLNVSPDRVLRHYTTSEAAAQILASGAIIPGGSGLVYVTPDAYTDGATAQAGLSLETTPDGYFEILVSRITGLSPLSTVDPFYGQPGGGLEATTASSIDISGLAFHTFTP
jgi:beta-lactam-binding protein with PASTA domain